MILSHHRQPLHRGIIARFLQHSHDFKDTFPGGVIVKARGMVLLDDEDRCVPRFGLPPAAPAFPETCMVVFFSSSDMRRP